LASQELFKADPPFKALLFQKSTSTSNKQNQKKQVFDRRSPLKQILLETGSTLEHIKNSSQKGRWNQVPLRTILELPRVITIVVFKSEVFWFLLRRFPAPGERTRAGLWLGSRSSAARESPRHSKSTRFKIILFENRCFSAPANQIPARKRKPLRWPLAEGAPEANPSPFFFRTGALD
jgi:hypothetical protein